MCGLHHRIFPPVCFHVSLWSMMSAEVVSRMLAGWEQIITPFFQVFQLHVQSGADHSTLVWPAHKVHNNFPSSVIINDFKLISVANLHHHSGKQMMTLEHSRMSTWRLPHFSTLLMLFHQPWRPCAPSWCISYLRSFILSTLKLLFGINNIWCHFFPTVTVSSDFQRTNRADFLNTYTWGGPGPG